MAAVVSRPLAVLDAARRLGIRALGPMARPLLGARDARVISFGVVGLLVAFVVAVTTGVVFGIYPARSAAKKDPIEALRHE